MRSCSTSTTVCTLANISEALPPGSSALRFYLGRVYGNSTLPGNAEATWSWARVQFVWSQHLPRELNEHCVWSRGPTGRGSVFHLSAHGSATEASRTPLPQYAPAGALWVYNYDEIALMGRSRAHLSSSGTTSMPRLRDPRLPHHDTAGDERDDGLSSNDGEYSERWVEVTHVFVRDQREKHGMFMYAARGSGLWYFTGKTRVLVSDGDGPRTQGGRAASRYLHAAAAAAASDDSAHRRGGADAGASVEEACVRQVRREPPHERVPLFQEGARRPPRRQGGRAAADGGLKGAARASAAGSLPCGPPAGRRLVPLPQPFARAARRLDGAGTPQAHRRFHLGEC